MIVFGYCRIIEQGLYSSYPGGI